MPGTSFSRSLTEGLIQTFQEYKNNICLELPIDADKYSAFVVDQFSQACVHVYYKIALLATLRIFVV